MRPTRLVILYISFVLSLLCSEYLEGQDIIEHKASIQQFSVEEGLSDRQVYHVFQDSRGFLWISTRFGINRYDGSEFKIYSRTEHGFRRDISFAILEDKKGRLWFQHHRDYGVSPDEQYWIIDVFDPIKERAAPLSDLGGVPFSEDDITWLGSDHSSNIWIGLKNGTLYKYDGQQFHLIRKDINTDRGANISRQNIAITSEGNIAWFYEDILQIMDSTGSVLHSFDLPPNIERIYSGSNGRIWLEQYRPFAERKPEDQISHWVKLWFQQGVSAPASLHNDDEDLFERYLYSQHATYEDREGRIWAFKDEKIHVFKISDGRRQNENSEQGQSQLITTIDRRFNKPTFISFDLQNNAWVSTFDGLVQISVQEPVFTNYMVSTELQDTRGIVEDLNGNLYMTAWAVYEVDKESGQKKEVSTVGHVGKMRDRHGNLWFGEYVMQVIKYDPLSGKSQPYQHPDFDPVNVVFAARELFEDREEKIWVGTGEDGLAYVDQKNQSLLLFEDYNQYTDLSKSGVTSFYENSEGIFITSSSGLYLLDPQQGIVEQINSDKSGLPFDNLLHLYAETDQIFWLGTAGGGLIRWDRTSNEFQQLTTREGLSDNVIYAIYEDKYGYFWLPSNNGLMRLNKTTHQVTTYLPSDGIPHKEFNTGSHYRGDDGRLYFGSLGGVTALYPEDFVGQSEESMNAKIFITRFEKFTSDGKILDITEQVSAQHMLHMQPGDRSIYLKFTLPNFIPNDKIRYAYKIEGWQNSWNFIGENSLRINGLPYGSYDLRLKAQNGKGQETTEDLVIPIVVEKPLHLKTWFLSAIPFMLVILGFSIYKWRTTQLKRDRRRLEKELFERTAIIRQQKDEIEVASATKDKLLAIIGHDLRGPLFSLQGIDGQIDYLFQSGQIDRLKNIGASIGKTTKYLSDILENLLTWSMHQMGKLPHDPENIKLKEAIEDVYGLFENNAKAKKVTLKMDVSPEIEVSVDKNAIGTILRNLVSNAIKFTHSESTIKISTQILEHEVLLTIEDEGIGFTEAELEELNNNTLMTSKKGTKGESGSGLGLSLVHDLIVQNLGSWEVKTKLGKGSAVEIRFPRIDNMRQ